MLGIRVTSHTNLFGKHIGNELKYIQQLLNSEDAEQKLKPFLPRFEKAFGNLIGSKYVIGQNSGTSTLHSCLIAAGVNAGDEVISPAHTVVMCGFATLYQNAIPVFADVNPRTFNIDPEDLEKKITPRTKAIIAVHMHGLPADMPRIMKIARRYKIPVIEDSAQSIFGSINGKMVGRWGDMASFSFETKKHLSTGEGGAVTTDNAKYAKIIRQSGGLGYRKLTAGNSLKAVLPVEFQDPNYKRYSVLGWNYRMNELTAAVALAQIERARIIVERRKAVANIISEAFEGCKWITPQLNPPDYENSYWTYTVLYNGDSSHGVSWRSFYKKFKSAGGDGFYGGVSVPYLEPVFQDKAFLKTYLPDVADYNQAFDYQAGLSPIAEKIQPKMMQFKTNYRDLTKARRQRDILHSVITDIERAN